jgi:hypothetical protein
MTRFFALLLAATLVAVPLASHAKGGGHGCGSGGGHGAHHGGGHSTTHFSAAPMSTHRAGYVRDDGTYVEPERPVAECSPSPDRPCEPGRPSPRR